MSGLGGTYNPNVDLPTAGQTYNLLNDDKLNRWGNVISSFQNIPGLVGFWPMSSVQRSTGNAYDLSGQGRTLTYNGNPTYNIHQDFMPYIDLDGTGDFLRRSDETDLQITGIESHNSIPGLTFGGWFNINTISAANQTLIGKRGAAGGNRGGYYLSARVDTNIRLTVSVDGTAQTIVEFATGLVANTWLFIVGRYIAATELKVWINENTVINTTSIPASLFQNNGNFAIGATGFASNLLAGQATMNFLSANALPDSLINGLRQQSRILLGV